MGCCSAKAKLIEQPTSDENLDQQKSTTKIDTLADLNAKISTAEGLVVIDFFAVWCPPCQNIAPCVEAMAKEFSSVLFLKVDADENEEACQKYNIEAMPTFVFVKDGQTVDTMCGADKDKLRNLINRHK